MTGWNLPPGVSEFDEHINPSDDEERFIAETEARGPYYCVVCGEVEVFPLDGQDTCAECDPYRP